MAEDSLHLVLEPSPGHGDPKSLELTAGGDAATLGRGPKNALVINLAGISNQHVELRLLKPPSGGQVSAAHLRVRDVSSNGTGMCGPKSVNQPAKLKKDTDTPVVDGSVIVLPLRAKVKSAESQARITLRVVEKEEKAEEKEKPKKKEKEEKKEPVKKKDCVQAEKEKEKAAKEEKPKEKAKAEKAEKVEKEKPKEKEKDTKEKDKKASKKAEKKDKS
ncbi:unnamed protein product [Effrenium voratum]|uniref:FHA domain-containing protein n=1 Tax=Effrenium voratum TaxID=2562239 RepID=A0AA36IUS1_9DINO|nr:unnamed protein product [Effrenium voratum]